MSSWKHCGGVIQETTARAEWEESVREQGGRSSEVRSDSIQKSGESDYILKKWVKSDEKAALSQVIYGVAESRATNITKYRAFSNSRNTHGQTGKMTEELDFKLLGHFAGFCIWSFIEFW
jgi:hypothetical protein